MTRQRRIGIAALLAALYGPALSPAAAAQTVVVGPQAPGVAAAPNGFVLVPVAADMTASGGASLGSFAGRLSWDPAVMRLQGVSPGSAGAPVYSADEPTGTLRFAVANPGGVGGQVVLANLVFQAVGTAGQTSTIGLIVDEITAAGSFADLAPITTATSSLFCIASGVYGDLNDDGSVNSADALVILTSSVGLSIAPLTTANGDVDGDGQVDPRDALIVLSYAIGLPLLPSFRPGQLSTGSCSVQLPASITLSPKPLSLAVGESVPLTPLVLDASGDIANPASLVWVSRDPGVAGVSATGVVSGVAPGSTYAVAIVSPTVMDSVPVTVTTARRVWYVNPALAAQNNGVELGSAEFPFSTIGPALLAAADDDTVRVALGLYGQTVLIRKRLTLIGDSTSAGMPRLRVEGGPAFVADTVRSVTIERFHVEDSQQGVVASASDTVILRSVLVERSRGSAVVIKSGDYASISGLRVVGAVLRGIDAESTTTLRLRQSSVDVVAPGPAGAGPLALHTRSVDTVSADTVFLGTAGARVDSAAVVSARGLTVLGSVGPALWVDDAMGVSVVGSDLSRAAPAAGQTLLSYDPASYAAAFDLSPGAVLRLDSTVIHDNGLYGLLAQGLESASLRGAAVERSSGGLAAALGVPVISITIPTITIAESRFVGNAYGRLELWAARTGSTVRVDSSLFEDTNLKVYAFDSFDMRGGQVLDGYDAAVRVEYTGVVSVVGTEVADTRVGFSTYGPWAIEVFAADSARLDSLWMHDNHGGAVLLDQVVASSAYGNRMENNWLTGDNYYYYYRSTMRVVGPQRSRLAQSVLDDRTSLVNYGLDVAFQNTGARVEVDTNTFYGHAFSSVYATGYGTAYNDTLRVRGSRAAAGGGTLGSGVYVYYVDRIEVLESVVDTASGSGIGAYSFGSVLARDNVLRGRLVYGSDGVQLYYGNAVKVENNAMSGCGGRAAYVYSVPADTLVGNTVSGCANGFELWGFSNGSLVVTDNVIAVDSANPIWAYGWFNRPRIARNDVSGRLRASGYGGIGLYSYYGTSDSAVVDSNLVHDGVGTGILTQGSINGISLRGNVVERVGRYFGYGGGMQLQHSAGGATLVGNTLRQIGGNGLEVDQSGYVVTLDSTVIVDDTAAAVRFMSSTSTVTGSLNYIARNDTGLTGQSATVTLNNSVFQGNRTYGAYGFSSWTLSDNWWGDLNGPRVRPPDDTVATTGDSAVGVVFSPWLTSAPSTPTGAPPAARLQAGRSGAAYLAGAPRPVGATRAVSAGHARPRPARVPVSRPEGMPVRPPIPPAPPGVRVEAPR